MLGVDISIPVFASPVGSTTLYDPAGAVAVADGAKRAGTTAFCGFMAEQSWESVAAVDAGRQLFQLYVLGDPDWLATVVSRVERAGYAGFCVTVDSARASRRDSLLESDLDWRLERQNATTNLQGLGRDESWRPKFVWSDLRKLCDETSLPVAVKGILSPRDAALAIEHGASAVYVSNHGGRALDHEPATIEVLSEIVEAVGSSGEVLVDGGFTRGVEVCAALALGAVSVGIGRLQLWGLAVGGAAGLAHVLDILTQEIESTMALLGATSVRDLDRDHVRWLV
jgi:isopentenyl diphosphate isomerase/L-lactate dehydrogenase-like FMN-dependent dehydrogenase